MPQSSNKKPPSYFYHFGAITIKNPRSGKYRTNLSVFRTTFQLGSADIRGKVKGNDLPEMFVCFGTVIHWVLTDWAVVVRQTQSGLLTMTNITDYACFLETLVTYYPNQRKVKALIANM